MNSRIILSITFGTFSLLAGCFSLIGCHASPPITNSSYKAFYSKTEVSYEVYALTDDDTDCARSKYAQDLCKGHKYYALDDTFYSSKNVYIVKCGN